MRLRITKIISKIRGDRLLLILVLGIMIFGGTASLLYINYSPSANKLCTVCHNMEPFYLGIVESGHKEINCHKCHPLGPEVVKELAVQIIRSPSASEIKEEFSPKINMYETCIECHNPDKLSELQIHEVHMEMATEIIGSCDVCHSPHDIQEQDRNCVKCHNEGDTIKEHSLFHDEAVMWLDRGNPDICLKCHSTEALWNVPLAPSCIKGQVEGKSCFSCHNTPLNPPEIAGESCLKCHR